MDGFFGFLLTPALATTAIFTPSSRGTIFFSQPLYLGSSVSTHTVPVALRALIDATSLSSWGQIVAMSLLPVLPIIGFFMTFQRLLVESISTAGFKG